MRAINRQLKKILLIIVLTAVMIPATLALPTHINISISETVHQNVTFAEDFDLVENQTYYLIEGVIIIVNPGNETVYDINLQLDNVENLASNFSYTSGREGFQVIYPDTNGSTENKTGNVNASAWLDLGQDLDDDGTNDFVQVNDTHIIFNLTSEFELHSQQFYNSSNASMDISVTPSVLNMSFNLTSTRVDGEYNDGVIFGNIQLNGTVTTASELVLGTEVTFQVEDYNRTYAILHIPELRTTQQTVYNYNISSGVLPPLDINSTYTNPEYQTKVLAGERFSINLSAANIATVGALTQVNITLTAEEVNVSNATAWEVFNFTLHNLSATGDYVNVVGNSTDNRTWYWGVNAGTIPIGGVYNVSFQMRAPDTVSTSGTHLALTQTLQYRIDTTASTLTVSDVRGRGSLVFNTTKRIVSPQDNASNFNVTWQSIPQVGTSENFTFTLEKVSLWVTTTLDPNAAWAGLSTTYNPGSNVNLSTTWTGAQWLFNFTDGSSDAAPPPIIWVKPYWIIRNTANQIVNSSFTVNGTDLYMNYIYVVNGYWLEVQKQVLDAGDSEFDIRIMVRNRGNGYTPQNLTVTIYDFIPTEFTAWNFSPTYNNASNVTGQFAGVAYQWDVGLRTNLSTSFAPRGDADGLDYFYTNYSVNGTGDFRVSDLYIVGLDPRLVDGANSFEGVSVISAIASTSREVIYLAIVVFLIAINVANFLMTSKINRKLDK